jgi:UDP-N-acetylglucosamine 1-carboxyvinyltransferase
MDKFRIRGGRRLEGAVAISGAKNAALPAMAMALLTSEPVTLENIPNVRDIVTMRRLLEHMRARVSSSEANQHAVTIEARELSHAEAPYDLVKTMRASILTLGPLVARSGYARISLPGGCAIGARPIDLHIRALEQMGAVITLNHGYVEARSEGLHGAEIAFEKITVTGTENIMAAATLADGETVLTNAAREPEIEDCARLLNRMGAKIEGAGASIIRIRGVASLHGATHHVIPDRIETGTFAIAAAITGGDLLLTNCAAAHVGAVIEKLSSCGVEFSEEGANPNQLRVRGKRPGTHLVARDLTTEEYPGFPTDMQAQYMALMTQAHGDATITETIFENRYLHASEMMRLGADISISGSQAIVHGPTPLIGARVIASDLRASACLVLAGLAAGNTTWIDRVYHIDRGYERIEERLRAVGADIERIRESDAAAPSPEHSA